MGPRVGCGSGAAEADASISMLRGAIGGVCFVQVFFFVSSCRVTWESVTWRKVFRALLFPKAGAIDDETEARFLIMFQLWQPILEFMPVIFR